VFLVTSVLLVLPFAGRAHIEPLSPATTLILLIVPTVASASAAMLITRWRGNGPVADLGLRFTPSDLVRGLGFGIMGLALSIPASLIWVSAVGPEQATSAVADAFTGQRFPFPAAIAVALTMWLVAPVCEEIVYRGLLWGAVTRLGGSRWWAFGVTTLLFALAHFELTRTPLLLVISIPIALARLYSQGIGASIVAHQVNNFIPALSVFLLLTGAAPVV
jgi:membrane protease YdiL (CAAX protease family)